MNTVVAVERAPAARVFSLDPGDLRWDAFVARHPRSTIYHHGLWLRVLEQAYGYRPSALGCEDDRGELLGVLPLVQVKSFSGITLSSLPRTPFAGPLTTAPGIAEILVRAAIERVQQNRGGRLEIRAWPRDLQEVTAGATAVHYATTYALRLPGPNQPLCLGSVRQHATLRRAAGTAERAGVRVREAQSEADLAAWYQLYLELMRDHAAPPRPYRFFQAAWELLHPGGHMRLLLADYGLAIPELVAGSVFLSAGSTVSYSYNGRTRKFLQLHLNDALQWRAIHDAAAGGFRFYDFGEVEGNNPGLVRFKTKWGAEPECLYRYYFPAQPAKARARSSIMRPAARAFWKRLPLPATVLLGHATAWIGDMLYDRLH